MSFSTMLGRTTALFRPGMAAQSIQVRNLNIHEYQGKELLRSFGVKTQNGSAATSPEEASKIAGGLKGEIVIKAQIHAGGRGVGTFKNGYKGGVKFAKTPQEVADISGKMLGETLVTKQTGPDGVLVQKVFVGESATIDTEKYFAILMDRAYGGPVMVGSPKGGVDIEAVAEEDPAAIFKSPVDIKKGINDEQLTQMARDLKFKDANIEDAKQQMKALYDVFIKSDCTMVEINPLAETPVGVMAADAKLNFDDNAEFRQKSLYEFRDPTQEDPRDVAAAEYGLNYIGLDGNIGCLVNGAGLAMATMDIVQLHGGSPANFLDVGGGANEKAVTEAFKILTSDPKVKAIMVNIFGGIMKCDTIANGIVGAFKQVNLKVPLVVRLEGTNVEMGKKILETSGMPIQTASDLDEAAKKAVASIS